MRWEWSAGRRPADIDPNSELVESRQLVAGDVIRMPDGVTWLAIEAVHFTRDNWGPLLFLELARHGFAQLRPWESVCRARRTH